MPAERADSGSNDTQKAEADSANTSMEFGCIAGGHDVCGMQRSSADIGRWSQSSGSSHRRRITKPAAPRCRRVSWGDMDGRHLQISADIL